MFSRLVQLLLFFPLALTTARSLSQDPRLAHFERRVRPVLLKNCVPCHGPRKQESGLRLDSREHLLAGGTLAGPAVHLSNPNDSPLLLAIRHQGDLQMPPARRLAESEILDMQEWVRAGVPWPTTDALTIQENPPTNWTDHWASAPLVRPPLPNGDEKSPIDRFILSQLRDRNLQFSGRADGRTLLRRVHYVLTGLPPEATTIRRFQREFLSHPEQALDRLVDQLLSSPQYGERWARHWLDLARYADTKGYVRLQEQQNYYYAYTYRDYVVESWNADLPYDQFVREQLAGDQIARQPKGRRPLAALGFLTLGRRFTGNQHDVIDDRIDVVTRTFLGLTVSCARCHDHKFDPIPTADYYGLYGVFSNTVEPSDLPYLTSHEQPVAFQGDPEVFRQKRAALDKQIQQYLPPTLDMLRADTTRYLRAVLTGRKTFLVPLPAAKGELRQTFVERWVEYLEGTKRSIHPVFGPWHALRSLPADAFAREARRALRTLSASAPQSLNQFILDRLAADPPQSMRDVADSYGQVLTAIYRETRAALRSNPDFVGFNNRDKEQLRTVLYGLGSPFAVSPREALDAYLLDAEWNRALSQAYLDYDAWLAGTGLAAPRAHVLYDSPRVHEPHIFIRGNPERVGEQVARAAPRLLGPELAAPFRRGSGRRELAEAIVHPSNPLTARVIVNRIWAHHFGRGLVATVSNFGLRAAPPTHPRLLDYLAYDLIDHEWSIKRLHRLILSSRTWRQDSRDRPAARQLDPDNQFLWRYRRRRVDFEILRDSMLSAAGKLDLQMLGPAIPLWQSGNARRTLYGHLDRSRLPTALRLFDFPSPDTHSPVRSGTTAPQQALFLMNNVFVKTRAAELAQRAIESAAAGNVDSTQAITTTLYRIALGRPPTAAELDRCHEGLAAGELDWPHIAQMLLISNEFLFID
ncbi:MAG: PSD1 and planctomycete cytochrome C domain-containing protein [Planctomycetota bacterium]|nr:PSD1 and planctomycete cytochrome C domain-containing protein [Planctomycetota bacterium]